MAKIALLIGVSEYEPGLNSLPGAVKDIDAMQRVLENPAIGSFDAVRTFLNPEPQAMQEAIELIFADRARDDLVLLFFSGHGMKDDQGRLYFGTRRTRKTERGDLVKSTAVSTNVIHDYMSNSRAKRQVVILDCCFSGAFATDMPAKAAQTEDISADIRQQLGSEGRVVLTSSTATQYAFEQLNAELSVYTRYLVEGLSTGAADQDSDGEISVDELHEYASSKVQEAAPAMKPEIYAVREGYKIKLARAPVGDPKLIYWKEVEDLIRGSGEISYLDRSILNAQRVNLRLSAEVAETIEAEVLKPYQERRQKLETYEQAWREVIQRETVISDITRLKLKRLQQTLKLRDEDVPAIEAALPLPKRPRTSAPAPSLSTPVSTPTPLPLVPAPVSTPTPSRNAAARNTRSVTAPVITRQQFLKWAGFGGGGLAVALLGNQIFQSSQSSKPIFIAEPKVTPPEAGAAKVSGLPLWTVEFETVLVDKRGSVTQRQPRRAKFVKEALGNGIELELVSIPAGSFQMGSPSTEAESTDDQRPQHQVTLKPFLMGRYPVTQAQWQAVAALPKVKLELKPDPSYLKGAKRPVERVAWEDAVEFCARLAKKTGRGYRLPSEAEWEYACRAGTTTPYYLGETITPDLANYDGNYAYGEASKGTYRKQTTDVGSFPASPFGLYDMHGNVWEWCADQWYGSYANKPEALKQNGAIAWTVENTKMSPKADAADDRLQRGGWWGDNPGACRSANRVRLRHDMRYYGSGFRLVFSAPSTLQL